jgi:hypothetical protein
MEYSNIYAFAYTVRIIHYIVHYDASVSFIILVAETKLRLNLPKPQFPKGVQTVAMNNYFYPCICTTRPVGNYFLFGDKQIQPVFW